MNALTEQLATLKLFGMAQTLTELLAMKQLPSFIAGLQQLIVAESTDRDVRRIRYQMKSARFPHHKDFATFNYSASAIERETIEPLCSGHFSATAHNIILIGGTGTGKTHTAIALGTELIQTGKKVRFYNAVDLINVLIKEQAEGRQGNLVKRLQMVDCVIID